ncbi:MMPL family transporter [Candidatus Saccharibacteria bacterium]|nr:MMPL family transporter [Candidatus Saccharibacteria bacterium]
MRKITDFIVNGRYFLLCVFVFLAVLSFIASLSLPVNYDISKYLPDDSETKVGLSIMEQEFDENSSTLNVMFSSLPEKENQKIINDISETENVSEVLYIDTTEYEDTRYTLFQVSVDAAKDSKEASKVYQTITKKYEDYKVKTQGEISDYNKSLLPIWLVVLAVACALIILVIMCNSYIEPFIFLFTILIGVALNKGTNLIFGEISNITSSIFPILQMALSMDYSIMLADRYDRERLKTNDKVLAMKNALHDSFKAISSSSITTVVGLLALIFMQFKIGEDLGLVLAKGVFFCLLSIFTCMPGLLVILDTAIQKTKKKKPNLKLSWLGKLEYRMRFISIPIFILVIIGCVFAKNGLGYDYTLTKINSVGQVFDLDNQIAVIYSNEDEEKIAKYCRSLDEHEKIKQVLCYGSTLNTELRYYELKDKFADFGVNDISVDDSILKLVYYLYHDGNSEVAIKLSSLIDFIETEIYPNESFSKDISDETKNNLTELASFIKPENYNRSYTSEELAKKFGIDKSLVDDLLIYYNSKNTNVRLTPAQFIEFIKNYVMNSSYASNIDSSSISSLNSIEKYTDKSTVTKAMSYSEMASFLGVSSSEMKEVYLYYILVNSFNTKPSLANFIAILKNPTLLSEKYCVNKRKITPKELISFIMGHKDDRIMKNRIDNSTIDNLKTLDSIIDSVSSGKTFSTQEISQFFGVSEEKIKLLYSLYDIKYNQKSVTITLRNFINLIVNDIAKNPEYKNQINSDDLAKLQFIQKIINNEAAGKAYTADEFYNTLSDFSADLNQNQIELVYLYYGSVNNFDEEHTMTIENFVYYLNDSILPDSRFEKYIDDDMKNTIADARSTVENGKRQLIGSKYSRFVLNTQYPVESEETFTFVKQAQADLKEAGVSEFYIIGNSPMSYEISQTFNDELNFITILTIIFIFVVVLLTFRSFSIPVVLVSLIQCAVFLAMGIMAFLDGSVYFIALLIVQSILMGATIDYAILYTSYYIEHRKIYNKEDALIKSYEKSLGAILTSALIVILVTLVVGYFTSDAAAKICIALSQGAFCSLILVVFLLPSLLSALDRFVTHQNKKHN